MLQICFFSFAAIHAKNLVAILHLLVTIARYYRAPIRMPENCVVSVVVVQVCFSKIFICNISENT